MNASLYYGSLCTRMNNSLVGFEQGPRTRKQLALTVEFLKLGTAFAFWALRAVSL